MKAFAVEEYHAAGDLSALKQVEIDKPSPEPRDLIVKIKAVATNPIDVKRLANMGNHTAVHTGPPLVVGWDAAGIIESVGRDVSLFKMGDEVMFAGDITRQGCFAEYTSVDERIVALKPHKFSFSQAAAVPLTSLTAWEALVDRLGINEDPAKNAGRTILITGGAGGVATIAIELAKKVFGLTVIASASRPETMAKVKELGADHVVNHHQSLQEQVKEIGMDEVDYILHCVKLTTELFADFCTLLKPFGSMCSIVPDAVVNLGLLKGKSLRVAAELMFTRPRLRTEACFRRHEILTKVADLITAGRLTDRSSHSQPLTLENLRSTLGTQATGAAIGKMTLHFE